MTASVVPANASNRTLIWESANTEIATVDANGKINALKQGSTIITVKSTDGSNISAQCDLTVVALVEGISINITTATLAEGQSLQLEATVSPEFASNKSVEWSSSNEAVATVSQDGIVTAISKGSAIITAKSTDGSNISASCAVTVVKLVSSIYIDNTKISMKIGEQTTITAYAIPSDATNPHLRWYSEDESIATVEDGVVTAVGVGTTYICVESTDGSNIVEKCEIEVGVTVGIASTISDAVHVYTANRIINITNVPSGQTVRIYLPNGTLVRSELSTGNPMTFQPTVNGIYIVVVGTNSYKVVIR